ncbi:ankyrin [Cadophora sp. DSE1049]|nr:ankyrin [Cadophora sp. DSE1049]
MSPTQAPRLNTNDLWTSAVAELSDKDRENIDFIRSDKLIILSELLELTTTSKEKCIEKRWRYKRKSGETIIFVDLFTKMAKWIDVFKQVGDIAVQYDPVHAALPWAGVRFLLQIAVNDIDEFGFVVEGATSIAEIICRYAIFEGVYLQSPSAATNELQRALIKFYAAIMTYLSKARRYFDQNTAMRRLKSGLLPQSAIESSFDAIGTAQEAVDRCSSMVGMQSQIDQHVGLKRLLECIDGPIERMSADLASLTDGFERSQRTKILHWLSPEPYLQHHEQAKREVLPGTGQWLLSDPVFNRWKKESVSSILWLHGVPGSGKSKLVSIVIEDARMAFKNDHNPAPVFFYCSRNTAEPARSNPDAIMASIARQLSSTQPGCPLLPPTVAAHKKREIEGFASGSLSINESSALIIQLAEQFPITTIVIDALDECDLEKRADLLEALESILRESASLVKIFVSSRDDQDIVWHLRSYPNLELSSDKNKDDIISFVQKETESLIQRGKLLRWSTDKENLRTKIMEKVTKDADGMFRWASLQLQSLCSLHTDEAIQERLGRLPPKLEELYLELYQKIKATTANADREIATGALSWLLCAQRKLSSEEFLAALSYTARGQFGKLTIEQVLHLCSNLIIFDPTLDTFRFAHLSVREFLEKQQECTPAATNALAAETCLLNVLSVVDNPATQRFISSYRNGLLTSPPSDRLNSYSSIYWAPHCQLASSERSVGVLKDLLFHFLSNELDARSPVLTWAARVKNELDDYSIAWDLRERLQDTEADRDRTLFIACCFDLQEAAILAIHIEDSVRNSRNRGPLEAAAIHGNCDVISRLIKYDNTQIGEEVLKAAARNSSNGKEVMILLLGQRGADVVITEEVVKAAAGNEEMGKEVMMLLLEQRGTDVVITEEVVKAAAGNEEIGKERGADVAITEEVVKAAAGNWRNGNEVMMLLLEQRGADVVITEEVVKAAAGNEDIGKEVMMLLLEQRGTEVVITEEVVKAAAGNWRNGKEVMILLLEQRGAEVVITEEVVKAAAGNEQMGKEVMMLLLEQRGAEVVITEEIVKAASTSGQESVLKLIQEDLEMSISEDQWLIAQFYNAAKLGNVDMIQQLLAKGVEPDLKNPRCVSPLWIAAVSGHHRVVQVLLSNTSVDVNSKSISARSPIFWAAARGYKAVVKLLLDAGADPGAMDIDGNTPLSKAKQNGFREIEIMMARHDSLYLLPATSLVA